MAMGDDLPGGFTCYRILPIPRQGQYFLAIGFKLLGGWFLAMALMEWSLCQRRIIS